MGGWRDIEACDEGADFDRSMTDHERMLNHYGIEEGEWIGMSLSEKSGVRFNWNRFDRPKDTP